jgi:hypothetical protein
VVLFILFSPGKTGLDFREHLKTVPDVLESLMSEKRLLQAAVLLVRSLKTISRPDMLEIGAVSDLRSYLAGQETVSQLLFNHSNSNITQGVEGNLDRGTSRPLIS